MRRGPIWLLIPLAAVLVWGNSLNNSFHYDDEHSIVLNIHLRAQPAWSDAGTRLLSFFASPSTFSRDADKGMYRPLLVTSFALNHAVNLWLGLDGYDVRGYHVINVLLHIINALLIRWLAIALWPTSRGQRVGLIAALLFVVWPLGAEPVNYISSRSESLAAGFYLGALALFAHARCRRLSWRWRSGVWVALGAGLLTKSTVITLPLALLLLDGAILCNFDPTRLRRRLWTWHAPGWLLMGSYLAIIVANRFLTRSLAAPVRDFWAQALTQTKAVGYYLQTLTLPTHLSVEPQFLEQTSASAVVVAAGGLTLTLLGALWKLGRRRCGLALTLAAIPILHMLPAMVIPLNVYVNERRLYLPLALLCLGLVALVDAGLRKRQARSMLVVALLLIAGMLSTQRNRAWADDESLWADAVKRSPQMARPHLYQGNTWKDRALRSSNPRQRSRNWQKATAAYEQVLKFRSGTDLRLRALNNLGGVHFEEGRLEAAEAAFRAAVDTSPDYADALINLGNVLLQRSRSGVTPARRQQLLRESVEYYHRGLQVEQNNYFGHSNLGVAMQDLGHLAEADAAYRRALYLQPSHYGSLTNLGVLLLTQFQQSGSDFQGLLEAQQLLRRSLAINRAQPKAVEALRQVEAQLRQGRAR